VKFDMSAAWNEATRLLAANRQLILIVAGVFFFLPYLAFALMFMNETAALEAARSAEPDPGRIGDAMADYYGSIWWAVVLLAVIQGIGLLAILTLLTDRARPTVAEALKTGVRLLLPYLGAQLLVSVVLGILILMAVAVGIGASALTALVGAIVAAVLVAYLFTRFLLTPPVIVVERVTNPITAIGRSWRLTGGNTLRVFAFVFLLILAVAIVGAVIGMIVGLVLALAGADAALLGQSIVSGLINAGFYVVFAGAIAATYHQLSADPTQRAPKTSRADEGEA
jgi:hypothetical protein